MARFSTGDNLLFTAADYRQPDATPVWAALSGLTGPAAHPLALLRRCCTPGWTHDGTLDGLLARPVGSLRRTGIDPTVVFVVALIAVVIIILLAA